MTLANDISRCNDATCHLRGSCARWVERYEGRVQQATFRRGLLPCCSFEPIRQEEPDPAQGDMFGAGGTCELCGHSLDGNAHGFDQCDADIDDDGNLVHSRSCTYCKHC